MSPEAPNLPGKPQLWYSLVRPCKGIQRMIVCRSESTDLASEIDANYEQLEPGHSLVVVHQRTQLPIPNDAWAETFLVLPSSGGAQALLSTASADAFRLGIPLLPGGRLKTRLMRAALWLPGVLQALCRQKRERMSVITKPADGHDEGNWRMYQTPVAVVEGVPGSLQKLVVLHRDGEHQHIYKLAGTVLARRAIQHEVKALTTLGGCGLAPRLVARDYGLDPNWFAQEILHGKRPKAQITPAVLTWLVSLATREHDHLGPQTVIPSLFDGRDWSKLGPEFERLANITRYCWTGGSIPCTQSHGDFTPWNARITEGGLVAFDWEFYNPIRPALFDLFHFILQCSVLLRQVPAEQAMDRAMRILRGPAQPLCRVAGVQDFEIEPLAALYLLLVAERDSILHQIECPEFDQVAWLTEARKLWATQLAEHLEKMMEGYKQAG